MRVVAGRFGGRSISSPPGHKTHPMSEKMRGAIFNALGDISGLSVLDVYAGSGAAGIEALSRGAKFVYFIEKDKSAQRTILENIESLNAVESTKVTQANISSWLENNPDKKFDIIIADPPYDKVNDTVLNSLCVALVTNGVLVLSLPPDHDVHIDNCKLVKEKSYGDSKLVFLKPE